MNSNPRSNLVPVRMAVFGLALAAVFALSGCATNQLPPATTATQPDLINLREGDSVRVSIPSSPTMDTTQQIRRDGKISLQLVGDVQAAGLTPAQLQANLIKLYDPQIAAKDITVSVVSSTFPVYVTGAVAHPGQVMSDHQLTALEAVMQAGGFDYSTANMRSVKIIRNENGVMKHYTVNLKREMENNQDVVPFYLKPGDIVYIGERLQLF